MARKNLTLPYLVLRLEKTIVSQIGAQALSWTGWRAEFVTSCRGRRPRSRRLRPLTQPHAQTFRHLSVEALN